VLGCADFGTTKIVIDNDVDEGVDQLYLEKIGGMEDGKGNGMRQDRLGIMELPLQ
jgi:hypothetical protein